MKELFKNFARGRACGRRQIASRDDVPFIVPYLAAREPESSDMQDRASRGFKSCGGRNPTAWSDKAL